MAVALIAVAVWVGMGPAGASTLPTASFRGHGGIDEAYVLGAPPREHLTLVNAAGANVSSGVVDRLGALLVRNVAPGPGYRFEAPGGADPSATRPFSVLSTHSTPPPSFYADQHLNVGLNYIEMRDGITLAATVRLPPGKTLADGPFPTVIEYSGYDVAGPASLIAALEGQASSTNPLLPSTSTIVGSVIAPLLGFATVSLQMRGTGCSGGAFDLFGFDSDFDGYDAVQIVGSQPWVLNHKVGMVGISYSGFSQLIVAGTDPPDLSAITPLSPTDDLFSTGYPGGIYNDGFSKSWIEQRISDGKAAPGGGQPWATAEIDAGDTTCLANQALHPEAEPLATLVGPSLSRTPALFNQRSPTDWAAHIKVPVFLAGSLEDEQVGPQWPALITALGHDKNVYVTMMNGTHIDSLGPNTISRWLEFLDIYVAGQVPKAPPILDPLASEIYASATSDAPSMTPPPIRFTDEPSLAAAKDAYAEGTPRRARVVRQRGRLARSRGAPADGLRELLVMADRGDDHPLLPRARRLAHDRPACARFGRQLPTQPGRPAGHRPARQRECVGRPTPIRLDHRARVQRPGLPDVAVLDHDHHRRPGQPRPVSEVQRAGHRPPGHRDRGATGRYRGGVRHLGVPRIL